MEEIDALDKAIKRFLKIFADDSKATPSVKYRAAHDLAEISGQNNIMGGFEKIKEATDEMIKTRRDIMLEKAEEKLDKLLENKQDKETIKSLREETVAKDEELKKQAAESHAQRLKDVSDMKHKMEERAKKEEPEKADVATTANVETYFDKLDKIVKSAKTLELLSKLPPAEFAKLSPETQMAVLNWEQLEQKVKDHKKKPLVPFKKQERLSIKAPVKLSALLRRELYDKI